MDYYLIYLIKVMLKLYLYLLSISLILQKLYIQNDKNIWNKLFKGLDDINLFLIIKIQTYIIL